MSGQGPVTFSRAMRCYSCKRPSWTEAEHVGHICRPRSRAVIAFWRRWAWRLFHWRSGLNWMRRQNRRGW
jgi:hypothetical protein